MMDQIRQSLTMISALALSCFSDGQTSLERVFSVHLVRNYFSINGIGNNNFFVTDFVARSVRWCASGNTRVDD